MAASLISYTSGDDSNQTFEGNAWLAQTFTVGATAINVTSAKVYVKTYNGAGEGYMYLKAVDENGKPSGDILATAPVTWPSGWGVTSWVEGTFSSPVDLSANTEYALIIRRVPTTDIIYWRYDNSSSTYTDGHRCTSSNSGSSWTVDSNATDFLFDIWGIELAPPNKPINPTPAHLASGIALHSTTGTWEDGGGATSYDVYFGTLSGFVSLVQSGVTDLSLALTDQKFDAYADIYYWRVDAVNEYGTTQGDEWAFTTLSFCPPLPHYTLILVDGPDFTHGDGINYGGTEGTDWFWDGYNFIRTSKKLVAAAKDTIWYEQYT